MLMNNIKIHQIRFFSNDIMLTIWNSQNAEENYCCLQETVVAGGENANIPYCCIKWCPFLFPGCHMKFHKDHFDKKEEFVAYCRCKLNNMLGLCNTL